MAETDYLVNLSWFGRGKYTIKKSRKQGKNAGHFSFRNGKAIILFNTFTAPFGDE